MSISKSRVIKISMLGMAVVLVMINSALAREGVKNRSPHFANSVRIVNKASLGIYRARKLGSHRILQRRALRANRRSRNIGGFHSRRRSDNLVLYFFQGNYYVRRGCRLSLYRSHIPAGPVIRLGRYQTNVILCSPIKLRRIDARSPWRQTRHYWLSHMRPSPTYPTPRH